VISVFIGGSRRITKLASPIKKRIDNIISNGFTILIGDAGGADTCVQEYLADHQYRNVIVFCMEGVCRNNIGDWVTRSIGSQDSSKGFGFYSIKDMHMAVEASYGFMIWDAKSNGTLNNMINLLKREKKVLVYFGPEESFYTLANFKSLSDLLTKCDSKTIEKFDRKLAIKQLLKDEQSELLFA